MKDENIDCRLFKTKFVFIIVNRQSLILILYPSSFILVLQRSDGFQHGVQLRFEGLHGRFRLIAGFI